MTPFSTPEPIPSPCDLSQLILLPETPGRKAIPLVFINPSQEIEAHTETNDNQSMRAETTSAHQPPLFQDLAAPIYTGKHAYALLCAKSHEIGWPRLWETDLTKHDAARLLAPDAPQRFCWSVRETGTWLYGGEPGNLWHLLCWELRASRGSRFFAYDAGMLTELSFHDATAFVRQLEVACNHDVFDEGRETAAPLSLLLHEAEQLKNSK